MVVLKRNEILSDDELNKMKVFIDYYSEEYILGKIIISRIIWCIS